VPSEVKVIHSQLLRVTLEAEHAQAYWIHARPELSIEQEAALAFGEYWFGVKSMPRVRNLLGAFRTRYAAYPEALAALRAWSDIDRDSRDVVGHWHLQLSDPLYRIFTGEFLPHRRLRGRGDVNRDAVLTWIAALDGEGMSTDEGIALTLIPTCATQTAARPGARPAARPPAARPAARPAPARPAP